MNKFSVVIPVYGCSAVLPTLVERLEKTLGKLSDEYEIILVNDSSPDDSWKRITGLAQTNQRIKGINLSRNFGQHNAITAGIQYSNGEWIIIMDCDLQDQPEEITKLYETANSLKCDVVFGKRIYRKDNFFKKSFSRIFYKLLGYLTDTYQDPSIGNFGIYNRKVINAVLNMGDQIRYFPTMVRWVGFKSGTVEIEHALRETGRTSYSYRKLIRLALDVILSFSDKPLKLTIKTGFVISIASFLFALYNLILFINDKIEVTGWASLIISIWFLSGLILIVLGIVGLYIGKTFEKVKNRPQFIIMDSINLEP